MKPYSEQFQRGWTGGPGVCGLGSLPVYAAPCRSRVHGFVDAYTTLTGAPPRILEVGCGDLVWHAGKLLSPTYTGVDLHPRDTWAEWRAKGAVLMARNAATAPDLPPADLVIARSVFIHLSNDLISAVLHNIRGTGARWLLATNLPGADNASRLPRGDDYSIDAKSLDLAAAPFSLAGRSDELRGFGLFDLGCDR